MYRDACPFTNSTPTSVPHYTGGADTECGYMAKGKRQSLESLLKKKEVTQGRVRVLNVILTLLALLMHNKLMRPNCEMATSQDWQPNAGHTAYSY